MKLNAHVKYKHDFYSEYVQSGLVEFTVEWHSRGEEGLAGCGLRVWHLKA